VLCFLLVSSYTIIVNETYTDKKTTNRKTMNIWNSQKLVATALLIISSILLTANTFVFFKNQDTSFLSGNISESTRSIQTQPAEFFQNTLSIPQSPEIIEISLTTKNGSLQVNSQSTSNQTTLETSANQESETLITSNENQTLLFSRSNPNTFTEEKEKSAQATIPTDQNFVVNAMITKTKSSINLKDHTSVVDMFYHQTDSTTTLQAPEELLEPLTFEVDSYNSVTKIYLPEGARLTIEGSTQNIFSQIPLVQVGPTKISNTGTSKHLYTLRLNQDPDSRTEIFTY
jgi:hypothetical protein